MTPNKFADSFLAILPTPVMVAKDLSNDLNHPVVYVNPAFVQQLGWTAADIPDKNHWWVHAYPDRDYLKVVSNQWELAIELALQRGESHVMMEVNVQTKDRGQRRFKVYSELKSSIVDGHYVVILQPC